MFDIVGYAYDADIYCPYCIATVIGGEKYADWEAESALADIWRERFPDKGEYLTVEHDSTEFPVPIFGTDSDVRWDHCRKCNDPIVDHTEVEHEVHCWKEYNTLISDEAAEKLSQKYFNRPAQSVTQEEIESEMEEAFPSEQDELRALLNWVEINWLD